MVPDARKTFRVVGLLAAGLWVGACAGPMPVPQESEFVRTIGGGLAIEDDVARLAIQYAIKKVPPAGLRLRCGFETPGGPVRAEDHHQAEPGEIVLYSPPIEGEIPLRNYVVLLHGYDPSSGELLFEHQDHLRVTRPPGF